MLFMKGPGNPGQAWHQDEYYIPTRDRSLCGAWIALDDATRDNGCLWVIPGSHRSGVLWSQRAHGNPEFDWADESYGFPYAASDEVAVEVPSGSLVLFNGYLLHRSLKNNTPDKFRRALVYHYMSAESFLPWFHRKEFRGWSFGSLDIRDVVMVAGEDPYAYKGLEEINAPFVRPATL
jgi:ectoine hydroxylase-related dioxygenase (phytanoyl-CoA dioxygenase family)